MALARAGFLAANLLAFLAGFFGAFLDLTFGAFLAGFLAAFFVAGFAIFLAGLAAFYTTGMAVLAMPTGSTA